MSRLSNYKQTTFALPKAFIVALESLSAKTRVPQAAFIREGVALMLKKYAAVLGDINITNEIERYAAPATINAHNALAWKEERSVPEILQAPQTIEITKSAPALERSCGMCATLGRTTCACAAEADR